VRILVTTCLLVCAIASISACGNTIESGYDDIDGDIINSIGVEADTTVETEVDNHQQDEYDYDWYLGIVRNFYDTPDTDVLGVLDDVNDLFTMTIGEAIDVLGPNHSEPYYYQMSLTVNYPGSCKIVTNAGPLNPEAYMAQMDSEARIIGIEVIQTVDIYKGISVGKTLDEINSNPNLLGKFVLPMYEGEYMRGGYGEFVAAGFYEHNGIGIEVYLSFDDDFVCTNVILKLSDGNPGYVEI